MRKDALVVGCLAAPRLGLCLRDEGPVAVDEVVVEATLDAASDAQSAANVEHVLQPKLQANHAVVDADGYAIAGLTEPRRRRRYIDGVQVVHRGGVQRLTIVDGPRAEAETGNAEQAG